MLKVSYSIAFRKRCVILPFFGIEDADCLYSVLFDDISKRKSKKTEDLPLMKMRSLVVSSKGKLKAIAELLAQNGTYAADDIPPAYPCDRERLVVIAVTAKNNMPDSFRRFCQELSKEKAQNVALVVDGNETNTKVIYDWIQSAGTHVIENILYFPVTGFFAGFSKKLTAEERSKVNAWYQDIQKDLT